MAVLSCGQRVQATTESKEVRRMLCYCLPFLFENMFRRYHFFINHQREAYEVFRPHQVKYVAQNVAPRQVRWLKTYKRHHFW